MTVAFRFGSLGFMAGVGDGVPINVCHTQVQTLPHHVQPAATPTCVDGLGWWPANLPDR